MIQSMTGYGKASLHFDQQKITVELKSLNSKNLEIRLKVPSLYQAKELEFRRLLSEHIIHGKVDLMLYIENAAQSEYKLDAQVIQSYYHQLLRISDQHGIPQGDILYTISRMPGVVIQEAADVPEEQWEQVQTTLFAALEQFKQFRLAEGESLRRDIQQRLSQIQHLLQSVEPHEEERFQKIRQRLWQQLERGELKSKVDENRFEQEMIYFLEKFDINEEKTRLSQHCLYFQAELDKADTPSKGSKLGFISQEMGREINTLGSKANSAEIQRLVVQMKDELEKIKEQLGNVL
jgi:uncharacterized protein (TIGR00255 family)